MRVYVKPTPVSQVHTSTPGLEERCEVKIVSEPTSARGEAEVADRRHAAHAGLKDVPQVEEHRGRVADEHARVEGLVKAEVWPLWFFNRVHDKARRIGRVDERVDPARCAADAERDEVAEERGELEAHDALHHRVPRLLGHYEARKQRDDEGRDGGDVPHWAQLPHPS
eukprot:CAMPEP_0183337470 /NCGR_PEP_ID=MMETSP0164_2-20130417/5100_1 /TAXON_ID=221442 /ORGANISM="Coccolithus pelagicus ssp braarudi, Strain PLY182g" /LENGTH=167 /DNA_ID=CAMNT_0025507163 /DNA_START=227 /DNA_END=730 /DNA_ORIENTATION=-